MTQSSHDQNPPEHHANETERPSKSARKREMHALQTIGETLVELPERELLTIPLSGELEEAIQTARRINSREGRRRQLQYIGKLMRRLDCTPIETALTELQAGRKQAARQFHALEALRDELIQQGPNALDRVLALHPEADRQHLRQLIMQAQREQNANKPPAASRKLFRYLRSLAEPE